MNRACCSWFICIALLLPLALASTAAPAHATATPAIGAIRVVAAESSYGSIVKTIGSPYVEVTSLLDSPDVDPHTFKASPRVARQLSGADLVIMNGLGYDDWMEKLLQVTRAPGRKVIVAGAAASQWVLPDKNPHLFYSPQAMLATAKRIAQALTVLDPRHGADYAAGLARFRQQLRPVHAQMQRLAAAHPRLTVAATEPIYGYMLDLLGYHVLYQQLQFATMNGSQPSARQVAEFARGLGNHTVQLLVYNKQVHDRLTESLVATAKKFAVPVLGVTELPLHGENYAKWQLAQLRQLRKTLDLGQ